MSSTSPVRVDKPPASQQFQQNLHHPENNDLVAAVAQSAKQTRIRMTAMWEIETFGARAIETFGNHINQHNAGAPKVSGRDLD